MKPGQYFICLAVSGLCLLMIVLLFVVGLSSNNLQLALQKQQEDINQRVTAQQEHLRRGNTSQQVGAALLRDMIQVAVQNNNPRLLELLEKNGIKFQPNTNAPAAAPAAPATPAKK